MPRHGPESSLILAGPSRYFGAAVTVFWGVFIAGMTVNIPGWGPWLGVSVLALSSCLTIRVARMAIVLGPDTMHVRQAFHASTTLKRCDIHGVKIVPSGNLGGSGVCLGLMLSDGTQLRIKAVGGYSGSAAVDDARKAIGEWAADGVPT